MACAFKSGFNNPCTGFKTQPGFTLGANGTLQLADVRFRPVGDGTMPQIFIKLPDDCRAIIWVAGQIPILPWQTRDT
jgi:hypothetical protein